MCICEHMCVFIYNCTGEGNQPKGILRDQTMELRNFITLLLAF